MLLSKQLLAEGFFFPGEDNNPNPATSATFV